MYIVIRYIINVITIIDVYRITIEKIYEQIIFIKSEISCLFIYYEYFFIIFNYTLKIFCNIK